MSETNNTGRREKERERQKERIEHFRPKFKFTNISEQYKVKGETDSIDFSKQYRNYIDEISKRKSKIDSFSDQWLERPTTKTSNNEEKKIIDILKPLAKKVDIRKNKYIIIKGLKTVYDIKNKRLELVKCDKSESACVVKQAYFTNDIIEHEGYYINTVKHYIEKFNSKYIDFHYIDFLLSKGYPISNLNLIKDIV